MEFFDIISNACTSVGLTLDEDKYNKLITYKDLIKEWNEKINLTAIIDDEEMVKKHLIDSIKAFNFGALKNARNLLDVGTGAGLPGIPLKIMMPELNVVLLDSLNKRIVFLNEVITQLKLENIKAIHGRAEDYAKEKEYREVFDIVISRAVANMSLLSELCIPYVKHGGYFVAMKGPAVDEEISGSSKAISALGGKLSEILQVSIEESDLKHNLVIIKKIKETPKAYPRKPGMAAKNPIR